VLAYDEALAHPQTAALGVIAAIPGADAGLRSTLATPFVLSEAPPTVRGPAPELDADGAALRAAFAAT
jgi:crotonobetainyl-CoA:carnitine CoA-transferase CaiB-like acyl-CoA transferase